MDTAVFPVNDNELIWLLVPAKPTTTKHIYDHLKSNRYTRRHVYLSIYLSVTPSGILFSKCPELTNTNQAKYQLPMRNYILFRRVFKKSALIFQPRTHSLTHSLTDSPAPFNHNNNSVYCDTDNDQGPISTTTNTHVTQSSTGEDIHADQQQDGN